MVDLAVVMISRNQEWNVARLIESVLKETSSVPTREIVLADSASTDNTTQIASNYPIDVLRLRPEQRLSAAAGRYVGYRHTTGRLVLFLDGDMELYPGWLEKALRLIRTNPEVAVVTGQTIDLPKKAGPEDKPPPAEKKRETYSEVRQGGGAALYRRSALEEVGTFNPYLYSEEEPELCVRIRHGAGYKAVRLHYPIAYHYTDPEGKLSTIVGRWRRNLYMGAGQNLHYHLGNNTFWPYVKERGYGCLPLGGLLAGLISLLWSLKTGRRAWFGLWLAALFGAVLASAYRKRSLYRALSGMLERAFYADGTIRGFLLEAPDPDSYPAKVDVIKSAGAGSFETRTD